MPPAMKIQNLFPAAILTFTLAFPASATLLPPIQKLEPNSMQVLEILKDNPEDFQELVKHGNRITDANIQYVNRRNTRIEIVIRNCRYLPSSCIGGAALRIVRNEMPSSPPHYEYSTRIDLIR